MLKKLLFIIAILSHSYQAHALLNGSQWTSPRIQEAVIGLSPFPDETQNLVLLGQKSLMVYSKDDWKLLASHKATSLDQWMKLTTHSDKTIFVSGYYAGRPQTQVFQYQEGALISLQTLSFFVHEIFWDGSKILIGQNSLAQDDFSGPIYRLEKQGGAYKLGASLGLPKNLSGESLPLYSLWGTKNGFATLSSTGKLKEYEKQNGRFVKVWESGLSYGGSAFQIKREIKNPLNQVEQDRLNVPPPFKGLAELKKPPVLDAYGFPIVQAEPEPEIYSKPRFILPKNEGFWGQVLGKAASIKSSTLSLLQWNSYGYSETWNSPRFDGAISDFYATDWNNDGKEDIVFSLLIRDKGYLDTSVPQGSLIVVVTP